MIIRISKHITKQAVVVLFQAGVAALLFAAFVSMTTAALVSLLMEAPL